jgi:hypothetical protein
MHIIEWVIQIPLSIAMSYGGLYAPHQFFFFFFNFFYVDNMVINKKLI